MPERVPLVEETACNLCGERDYEVVGERDRDGRPLRTTICRRCGLVWTNPRPTLEALADYYGAHYRADYKHMPAPTPRKVLRGMLGALDRRRLIGPLMKDGARVLDVGCGAGELVFALRAAGIEAEGLEPDEAYARYAREALGVPVRTGTVDASSIAPASWDVVTMFHALEHVGNPLATLRRLSESLTPGGVLIVEVPNVEAVCQAPPHRFHYAHLFSFSPGTLQALAARAGFGPLDVSLSGDGGNILGVFREDASAAARVAARRDQYERTRRLLRAHTAAGHYLSATPYSRAIGRFRRRLREARLLRRFSSVPAILSAVKAGTLDHNGSRA